MKRAIEALWVNRLRRRLQLTGLVLVRLCAMAAALSTHIARKGTKMGPVGGGWRQPARMLLIAAREGAWQKTGHDPGK